MRKSTTEMLLDKSLKNNETQGLNNVWLFHCRAGLQQSTCGIYELDASSRGARSRMSGCSSCVHRSAANEATRAKENE